jgi:hypothetical protein
MNVVTDNYNPKVSNPWSSNNTPQMKSSSSQAPFFFGGSQVPFNLGISQSPTIIGGQIKKPKFKRLDQAETRQLIAIPHILPFRK